MRNVLRTTLKGALLLGASLLVIVLSLGIYLAYFYPSDLNRVRLDSPLRNVIRPEGGSYNETTIRTAILEQLPLGATSQEMQAFLTKHFDGARYSISRKGTKAIRISGEPYVHLRAIDIATYAGGEYVDLYLILSPSEQLKDVIVQCHRVYL